MLAPFLSDVGASGATFMLLAGASRLVQQHVERPASLPSECQLDTFITSSSATNAYLYPTENQQFISEVWSEVTSRYLDQSFNGLGLKGWKLVEQQALIAVQNAGSDDDDLVNDAVKEMLSKLNNPFTRFLPKQEYDIHVSKLKGEGSIGVQATSFTIDSGKKIGLIKIPMFTEETVPQLVDGLRSITSESKIGAIAIDLRGNPGGDMRAGVDAAKLFLPAGSKIESEVDKSGNVKTYEADGAGAHTSMPLYILIDKGTASAAETFSAALQDNKRAVILGTTNSFGKGTTTKWIRLQNGSGVGVTTARSITPNGSDINGIGISPDKKLSQCDGDDCIKTGSQIL